MMISFLGVRTDRQTDRHGFGILTWKHVGTQKISTQSSKLVVSRRSLYASPEDGMHNYSTKQYSYKQKKVPKCQILLKKLQLNHPEATKQTMIKKLNMRTTREFNQAEKSRKSGVAQKKFALLIYCIETFNFH